MKFEQNRNHVYLSSNQISLIFFLPQVDKCRSRMGYFVHLFLHQCLIDCEYEFFMGVFIYICLVKYISFVILMHF